MFALAAMIGGLAAQTASATPSAAITQPEYNRLLHIAVTMVCPAGFDTKGAFLDNAAALAPLGFTPEAAVNKLGYGPDATVRMASSAGPAATYTLNALGSTADRCFVSGQDRQKNSIAAKVLFKSLVPSVELDSSFPDKGVLVPLPKTKGGRSLAIMFLRSPGTKKAPERFDAYVVPDSPGKAS